MPAKKDSSVQVAIIVAVLLAVVGGAWLFLNMTADEAVEAGQITAVEPTIEDETSSRDKELLPVDTALQMAEMAFQSGQLVDSEEDSAFDFYR